MKSESLNFNFNFYLKAIGKPKSSDIIYPVFLLVQVRDYANKKKSAGGKLVDATAETDAEIKREMEKIAKNFGGEAGADMTKFPDVKFENPAIEVPDLK